MEDIRGCCGRIAASIGDPGKANPGLLEQYQSLFWSGRGRRIFSGALPLNKGSRLAIRIGEYLKRRAETDASGLKWVKAENRTEPDNLQAQTGLMQGAAGIGLFFIHLSQLHGVAEAGNRFPDSLW